MADLKAAALKQGYYRVSRAEQALRLIELIGAPIAAFTLLTFGGALAALGAIVLGVSYPRAAYLGHDIGHNQWGPRDEKRLRPLIALVTLAQGFGMTWWVEKHELHHSFPNAIRMGEEGHFTPVDGDIDSPPWIVWDKSLAGYNDKARESFWGRAFSWAFPRFQVPLFFPLLALARFNWSWQAIETAIQKGKRLETSIALAHWGIGAALAMFLTPGPFWTGLLWFFCAQCIGGFILAAVFVLNHTGMEVYDATQAQGFYDRQARSTRNTPSSPFFDWLTGGLNSQIEHHMFPTMARRNLPKMRDATRTAMLECGYAYEELSNRQAMRAVLGALSEAARA